MSRDNTRSVGSLRHGRRASVVVAMIVVLLTVDLIIIAMVLGGAREHDLTIRRKQTIESFYAAEAGANMSIRELIEDLDEDLDGTTGTISDDGDPANDPAFGSAQFYVTISLDFPEVGQKTLTSQGRSGDARRKLESVLK